MKGSRKQQIPQVMLDWMAKANEDWSPSYPFNDPAVRDAVKVSLYQEQRGLCVYCGRKLNLDRPFRVHVEHFRPQESYKDLSVEYTNLFLSCGHQEESGTPSQTCGVHKDNWFDEEKHVHPTYPTCTERFKFLLSGHISTAAANDEQAQEMIDRLNLNHKELVRERETVLTYLDLGQVTRETFWDEETRTSDSYGHMAYQHLGIRLP